MRALLLALLLLAPLAAAQDAEGAPREIELVAHDEGGRFFFTLAGNTTANPELLLPAGVEVTLTMLNAQDTVHNLVIPQLAKTDWVNKAGATTSVTFTTPESGVFEYYCEPHRSGGMRGTVRIEGTPADVRAEAPAAGVAAALVALAVAGAARRRARS